MLIIPTEKRFDLKHTPFVLFLIVMANILIFFGYQSGDNDKFEYALTVYEDHDFFQFEWPLFENYLIYQDEHELLDDYRELISDDEPYPVMAALLMRLDFYEHLNQRKQELLPENALIEWKHYRQEVYETIKSLSFINYGLIPRELSPVTLLSHQFLHGDVLHLLGNLFFLIICGFAVEAALGHLRFLFFYLISGIAGGGFYAAMDLNNSSTLIGASGAISGVMAMYLAIFRLKKIEFFYWFFVFVGYFRAPALLILPFYIGKEVFNYYNDSGSNIAFMAHAGGFIAGSLLIGIAWLINRNMLNEEYIEDDQSVDPIQEKLAKIYSCFENYRFDSALQELDALIAEQGLNFELAMLRYNILRHTYPANKPPKVSKPEALQKSLVDLLKMKKLSLFELKKLEKIWMDNPEEQLLLEEEDLIRLGINFSDIDHYRSAEQIFQRLQASNSQNISLGVLARKLSNVHQLLNNSEQQRKYMQLAESFLARNV